MTPQTKSIIAHITLIGWVIALLLNNENKDVQTSFYVRQTLGLYITGLVLSFIPILGWILSLVVFAFWVLSLINAIQNNMNEIPLVGKFYQDLFKGI